MALLRPRKVIGNQVKRSVGKRVGERCHEYQNHGEGCCGSHCHHRLFLKNGTVTFPRAGCEQLLAQLFNLGVEAHDDLVDGLVWMIWGLVEQGLQLPKIHWIET